MHLLLYAAIVFRQVGSDVPITRSRIGEVKGCGALRCDWQDQGETGAPQRRIGKHGSYGVYDRRGPPSNMAARERERREREEVLKRFETKIQQG